MVKGRLNRESNPVPGEKPGFTPQHEKEDGSFANTGEGNPFPTNDSAVKAELKDIKQTQSDIIAALQATNETLQGTLNTQLTGSITEEKIASKKKVGSSALNILGTFNVDDAKKLHIPVVADSGHGYTLDITPLSNENDSLVNKSDRITLESKGSIRLNINEKSIDINSKKIRVILYNDDVEKDHTYDCWLIKRR